MDKAMTAAAWHREQARNQRISGTKFPPASNPARRYAETAAYHDAAADALEALAVPGVQEIIAGHLDSRFLDSDGEWFGIQKETRAALATLAKIGSER